MTIRVTHLSALLLIATTLLLAPVANAGGVEGDALFFCAGVPITAHWNDVATGKLVSSVDTPVSIPFFNAQAAVADRSQKLYHYFWAREGGDRKYTLFTYSFASSPLRLVGTCDFTLPTPYSVQCAVTGANGKVFFTATRPTSGGLTEVTLFAIDLTTCGLTTVSNISVLLPFGPSKCVYYEQAGHGFVAFYNLEALRDGDRPSLVSLDTEVSGTRSRKTYIYPRLPIFSAARYANDLASDGQTLYWSGVTSMSNSTMVSISPSGVATQLFSVNHPTNKLISYTQDSLLLLSFQAPSMLVSNTGKELWTSAQAMEGSRNCPTYGGLVFSPR